MKRFVSMLLIIIMAFFSSFSTFLTFAEESETSANPADSEEAKDETVEDLLSFSCVYDAESNKISINGAMQYEALAEHKKSKLLIYSVPPGASEYEVAKKEKPITETAVSIRFDLTFSQKDFLGRYSKYAIFLRTADGKLILGTEAQYPEVASTIKKDSDKTYFKGLVGAENSYYSGIDAGTVILPVYLEDLFTETSAGYVYHLDEGQFFFSKNYIDKLDSIINSFSVSGAKVYLQYLLREGSSFGVKNAEKAKYYMPNVYNEDTLLRIHSLTDFLVSRYSESLGGCISGIVVGHSWDSFEQNNNCSSYDFEVYAKKCADYTIVVANAARSVNSSIDIVLPFSAENFKASADFSGVEKKTFSTKSLIESVMYYLDNSFESGIACSLLLQSNEVPFGISNRNISDGVDLDFSDYREEIYAGNQAYFSSFLKEISNKYTSVPKDYIFRWSVPEELNGNALSCAYAYSYYALRNDKNVSAFVMDLSSGDVSRINEIYKIAKYIDTSESSAITKNLLGFFGKKSWSEIVDNAADSDSNAKYIYTATPIDGLPAEVKGSFKYFDFSDAFSNDGWYRGIGCQSLKLAYASSNQKALSAQFKLNNGSRSEIIYDYEKYENLTYTPYLKFDLQISDATFGSLYEVMVVFENKDARLETSSIVSSNKAAEIVIKLDHKDYVGKFDNIESLKISVRALNGEHENCALWLYGISGYSLKYSSDKLESFIEKERNKINNELSESSEDAFDQTIIAIVLVLISGVLVIGIFILIRKDTRSNKNE